MPSNSQSASAKTQHGAQGNRALTDADDSTPETAVAVSMKRKYTKRANSKLSPDVSVPKKGRQSTSKIIITKLPVQPAVEIGQTNISTLQSAGQVESDLRNHISALTTHISKLVASNPHVDANVLFPVTKSPGSTLNGRKVIFDDYRGGTSRNPLVDLSGETEDAITSEDEHQVKTFLPKQSSYDFNSVTKNLPKFKGGIDDHFETYELNTRLYMDTQCRKMTEAQKVTAILLKIEGNPRMILQGCSNLSSIDAVFDALRPTYGQDELTMLAQIKQLKGEAVKVFYSRLKTNLQLLGYTDSTKGNRVYLNYFVDGLSSSIRSVLKNLRPQRLQDALALANQIESEQLVEDAKKAKKSCESLFQHGHDSDDDRHQVYSDSLTTLQTNAVDKLSKVMGNRLTVIEDKLDRFKNHDSASPAKQRSRDYESSARRSSTRNYDTRQDRSTEYPPIKCFGCKEEGHRYRNCGKLRSGQREQISQELRDFYHSDAYLRSPNTYSPRKYFKSAVSLNEENVSGSPRRS